MEMIAGSNTSRRDTVKIAHRFIGGKSKIESRQSRRDG